jgi:MtN3 and saliva related transmembrane protein
MEGWAISLLGTVAGLCTTGSFVPQVIKAWRERDTAAISTKMYVIISGAFVLWLGYGVLIGSWPMVIFNVLNLGLSGAILLLKFRSGRTPRGHFSELRTRVRDPVRRAKRQLHGREFRARSEFIGSAVCRLVQDRSTKRCRRAESLPLRAGSMSTIEPDSRSAAQCERRPVCR